MSKKNTQKHVQKNRRYLKLISVAEQKIGAGQLASGVDLLSEAVALRPELPEAWHKLGAALYFTAETERACDAFARAVSLDEGHFGYINDLGGIYLSLGRFIDAENAFRKAVQLEPRSIEARYNLATCLSEQRKFLDAVPLLQEVISENPALEEAKFNLGLALRMMGKPEQAKPWLKQVLSDGLPMAQLELARCYRDSGNWLKAKSAYGLVNGSLMDEMVSAEFAETIYLNGNTKEAIEFLQNTRERLPQAVRRLELLQADIYLNSGELAKAKTIAERLVSEQDYDDDYFLGAANLLVRMESATEIDESVHNKLLSRLELTNKSSEELAELNFTLAKFHDNANEFSAAEKYYIEANRLKKLGISYDRTQQELLVESIIEFFSQEKAHAPENDTHPSPSREPIEPVFVVGLPRSGTTLLEQVLAAHSSVSSAGELGFFSNSAFKMQALFELEQAYPSGLGALSSEQLLSLRNTYLALLNRHNTGARYVTDKMPENYLHIGFIRLLFPAAKIIHVKREPADIAVSIFCQNFAQGNRYAFAIGDIAHYFVQYDRLMTFWHSQGDPGLLEVKYEDLVREPESSSKKLFAFLQIPWEAESLEYYQNKTDVRTASNWQVRQPLYLSSIGRAANYPTLKAIFKNEMSAELNGLASK